MLKERNPYPILPNVANLLGWKDSDTPAFLVPFQLILPGRYTTVSPAEAPRPVPGTSRGEQALADAT